MERPPNDSENRQLFVGPSSRFLGKSNGVAIVCIVVSMPSPLPPKKKKHYTLFSAKLPLIYKLQSPPILGNSRYLLFFVWLPP